MFTVTKDTPLSVELIKNAIKYNEEKREDFNQLENYYLGDHNILYRNKPITAKNNRIVVNHAKYITDTNIGYLLGNPVDYDAGDFNIDEVKNQYKQQTIADVDHEIAKDLSIFGKQYELVYNIDNNIRSKDIDVRNCVCVYDDTVNHDKMFGIIYKKSEAFEKYTDVVVYDKNYSYNCTDGNGNITIGLPNTHKFLAVPIIEYRNNSEEQGDFKQVISLIDAYNILQSDRINDKEQLVEAILVGYGVTLEKAQMEELLANRTAFGLPIDSKMEYLIKALDEGQIDILRKTIEADIHKISQVPNMADQEFVGNSSGVAIRYKLLSFEQNTKNKERYFEKGLADRFELYNNYLVSISKMSFVPKYELNITFTRNLPQNDLEIAQTISLLKGTLTEKTLIGLLPFIDDAEQEAKDAKDEQTEKYNSEVGEFGTLNETVDKASNKVGEEVKTKKKSVLEKLSDFIGQ